MTFTVDLPPALVEKLNAHVAAYGMSIDTFVRQALEISLIRAKGSFREIMKPVHDDFKRSGQTDEELDAFLEQQIAAMRAEKRAAATL